ncbi:hypothetical protein EYF80_036784 [Liparis tanakae]|uniref:Uncharacterized protein n=1 Tax=Liparis tanakae TaxID=230148 RepID=A0A4Z2GIE1_9TELE|nr:hypothetical protein EYF80_036784 [Liparis tanakae]
MEEEGGRAGDEGRAGHEDHGGAVSFGGLEGEGQLGPGLALAQDDFLLLLLLLLTVLVQLHALLVNLSLLLYNAQLLLGLSKANGRQKEQVRVGHNKHCCTNESDVDFSRHRSRVRLIPTESRAKAVRYKVDHGTLTVQDRVTGSGKAAGRLRNTVSAASSSWSSTVTSVGHFWFIGRKIVTHRGHSPSNAGAHGLDAGEGPRPDVRGREQVLEPVGPRGFDPTNLGGGQNPPD